MNGGIGRGKHSFPQPLLQLIDSKVRARKAVLNKKPSRRSESAFASVDESTIGYYFDPDLMSDCEHY